MRLRGDEHNAPEPLLAFSMSLPKELVVGMGARVGE